MAHSMAIEWFKRQSAMQKLVAKYDALRADPHADQAALKEAEDAVEALRAEILDAQMKRLRGESAD